MIRVPDLVSGERVRRESLDIVARLYASVGLLAVVRPCRLAAGLHWCSIRVLSPAARERFAEELLDELFDLAEQKASRRRQAACALRQLPRAWSLRRLARPTATTERLV